MSHIIHTQNQKILTGFGVLSFWSPNSYIFPITPEIKFVRPFCHIIRFPKLFGYCVLFKETRGVYLHSHLWNSMFMFIPSSCLFLIFVNIRDLYVKQLFGRLIRRSSCLGIIKCDFFFVTHCKCMIVYIVILQTFQAQSKSDRVY